MKIYEEYLVSLHERLEPLGLPVFFDMTQVPENCHDFVLIEASTSNTSPTAQSGRIIESYSQLISIYTSLGRTKAESIRARAVRSLGRNLAINHSLQKDNSIGVELYHISIRINEILI